MLKKNKMKGGMEVLDYIIGAIVKTITYLFAVTISAIVSTQTYFLFMLLIIGTDSVLGLMNLKNFRKEFVWNKLFFNGVVLKVVVYSLIILTTYKIDQIFIQNVYESKAPLVLAMALIFFSEIKSVYRNFDKYRNGNIKEDADLLKTTLEWLRDIIDAVRGTKLNKKDKYDETDVE